MAVSDHVVVGVVLAVAAASIALAGLRWLRVAQREHYAAGAASRFALRWWAGAPLNAAALVIGGAGVVLAARWPACALATAVVVAAGPVGLGLRGRTSPLAWTRRLRTLSASWAALEAGAVVGGALVGQGAVAAAAAALAVPALVDLACALAAPVERRLASAHVARAAARLRQVAPTVVAVTGSYGKTTTKGYITHLLGGSRRVVPSPASFNNRAGLARAINEHLAEGTDVFVAEMGTYGPGEIAELCSWIAPDVAVITAVGPVHLERFGSEDRVLAAKAEILDGAPAAVVVVDDPRLDRLADERGAPGVRMWRVSGGRADGRADVRAVEGPNGLTVAVGGEVIARDVAVHAHPGNVAAAVAVALELGMAAPEVARRLPTLPVAAHRLEQSTSPRGVVVIDDTYNSNPAGAAAALAALDRTGRNAPRRAVVTPGMVELGPIQAAENARFARHAATVATDLIVVGQTNRRALLHGAHDGCRPIDGAQSLRVVTVATRQRATEWVRTHLDANDVVLYENDLPDHYP
jgi:UDP-N-acetylmuramoyl-tripeptide--D-alanyl-D-alanine ligase